MGKIEKDSFLIKIGLVGVLVLGGVVAWGDNVNVGEKKTVTYEDYQRADSYKSGKLARLPYNQHLKLNWLDDNRFAWYRSLSSKGEKFILVDSVTGKKSAAFDQKRLAGVLSGIVGTEIRSSYLPFNRITFTEGKSVFRFDWQKKKWQCDLKDYSVKKVRPIRQVAAKRKRAWNVSPNDKFRIDHQSNNLGLTTFSNKTKSVLTTDGSPKRVYRLSSWSPASSKVLVSNMTQGDNRKLTVVESRPKHQLMPKLKTYQYDLPGDKLAFQSLSVIDVKTKKCVDVKLAPFDWWGPRETRWDANGKFVSFIVNDRAFKRRRFYRVSAETGDVRTLIDEKSETNLPPMNFFFNYVENGKKLLWSSESDGWNHLYLYDAKTGKQIRQLTTGNWVVRGIEHIDEGKGQVYFKASGKESGRDPYLIHYYRINLDGSGLTSLTPGDGAHDIEWSPNREFYTDRYSRGDMAPVTELRKTADASLVCELEKTNIKKLLATGWKMPEPFMAKGRDGKTDIWGIIYRPSKLRRNKKYPVIEYIYGGPHGAFTPKAFHCNHGTQALAELGFIVVQVDGMGTNYRSKAFHDVSYANLGDSGFADRIAWMKEAAKKYPYMDITRVGIYGGSAGGYNALRALIEFNDFYKVASANSGNHDHRTDKVWWNELWMGYPIGSHYKEQSNIEQAHKMKGKLLLAHGELDTNVNPFASSMQVAHALIKANKDFEMWLHPGKGHCIGSPYFTRKQWDFFVRNLHGTEPPKEYKMTQVGGDMRCAVTFINNYSMIVDLFWVGSEGLLKKYHTLKPGQKKKSSSFIGHDWEAKSNGITIDRFTVYGENSKWEVSSSTSIEFENKSAGNIEIYWVPNKGKSVRYHTLSPGSRTTQPTHVGNKWEARVDGKVISSYTVNLDKPVWKIK